MSLKLISTFGDHSSLYPLATKDIINSLGMTAYSYDQGGTDKESKLIDAKDRFIDEFGTEAIWLGGIPFFKWFADKTIYKAFKLNPNIDIRLIADKEQLEVAKKYALQFSQQLSKPELAQTLLDAEKNSKLFKGLFITKFAAATALTLASYFTLTKMKQMYTDKQVQKSILKKMAKEQELTKHISNNPTFKAFLTNQSNDASLDTKNSSKLSFKGLGSIIQKFMFDPVQNMLLLDAGITSERLLMARNKHEKAEYAIKEASLLFFLYIAGKNVQQGIEWISSKLFKTPINLHIEFLASDTFKNALKNKEVASHLDEFNQVVNQSNLTKSNKPIYEFLFNEANADNLLVKAAKKSGILSVVDESAKKPNIIQRFINVFKITSKPEFGKVNPHQFININEIKELAKNIAEFENAQKLANSSNSKMTIEKFLNNAKKFKVGSVIANIGVCCTFLGLIVPYCMKKYKEKYYGEGSHIQASAQQRMQMAMK